jgi:hypothetical protein
MRVQEMFLLLVILFIYPSEGRSAMDLKQLLEQKSQHYQELNSYYRSLLGSVKINDDKLFCQQVLNSVNLLNGIFEDDLILIKMLRTSTDVDFLEYATHLEENSFSPLFSSHAYQELCDLGQREEILGLTISLQYHVMNIDYLNLSHQLFSESIPSI